MIYAPHLSKLKSFCLVSILIISTTACTTTANKKKAATIDPAQVKNIQFQFEHSVDLFGKPLPSTEMTSRVAANLLHAGYPVSAANKAAYTHKLKAQISDITKSSTPVGFSYSAGDSDPRAGNFQKAKVLPITCTLIANNPQQNQAEFKMDFSSRKYLRYGQQPHERAKLVTLLVDDISTTCFNLLHNLKVKSQRNKRKMRLKTKPAAQNPISPAPTTSGVTSQSAVAPATKTVTEVQKTNTPVPVIVSPALVTPKAETTTIDPSVNTLAPELAPQSTDKQEPSIATESPTSGTAKPAVKTASPETDSLASGTESVTQPSDEFTSVPESTWESSWMPSIIIENDNAGATADDKLPDNEDGRKRIIIHNEGSPVILQMGHER